MIRRLREVTLIKSYPLPNAQVLESESRTEGKVGSRKRYPMIPWQKSMIMAPGPSLNGPTYMGRCILGTGEYPNICSTVGEGCRLTMISWDLRASWYPFRTSVHKWSSGPHLIHVRPTETIKKQFSLWMYNWNRYLGNLAQFPHWFVA